MLSDFNVSEEDVDNRLSAIDNSSLALLYSESVSCEKAQNERIKQKSILRHLNPTRIFENEQ